MAMDEIERLEQALLKAAFELTAATGSLAFSIPVPNTTPKLYVCLGESEEIRVLLDDWTTSGVAEGVQHPPPVLRLVQDCTTQ
jgi:hypothetical protein